MTIVFRFPRRRCWMGVSFKDLSNGKKKSTYLRDNITHLLFPIQARWILGKEDIICTSAHTSHKCEPSAVTSHNFNDESPGVRTCSSVDVIDSLTNSSQR